MTVFKDDRKSVPPSKSGNFLDSMREVVQTYLGMQGDKLDRGVTVRDLAAAGLIDVSKTYLAGNSRNPIGSINTVITSPGEGGTVIIPGVTYEPDLTPPPTPTGFVASAGIAFIIVECDGQTYTAGHGHAVTNLYGAKVGPGAPPTFANAVLLTSFAGTVGPYPTEPNTEWRLWIKSQTKDGVESASPAGGTNGLAVKTGQNVENLLNALSIAARDNSSPYARVVWRADQFYMVANDLDGVDTPVFSVVTVPITVGGVTVPVGTYLRDAFIQNGTITNLKVANAAIDNLKIANVSASKLTAGTISVGEYIQSSAYVAGLSGWRINGAGNVEFNNAVFRGSAFVGNGSVGGINIQPTYIQSSNYDGAGSGFRLAADGTLDLPGGSISANMLNIGTGGNLLANSQWLDTSGYSNSVPTGWTFDYNEPSLQVFRTPENQPDWCPVGYNGICLYSASGPVADPNSRVMYITASFPCYPGRRYEASVYSGAHRCRIRLDIEWHDGSNNIISISNDGGIENVAEQSGGRNLTAFKRVGCFGVAPNNAAFGRVRLIKAGTISGSDSYAFLVAPYVGAAQARQASFSPYTPAGNGVRITPQGINTPSLQALSGVMGNLYAGSVRGGSYGGGYNWPGDGGGGFYLGPEGLLLGNGNTGRYFQVEASGNVYMPGLQVINGTLYFNQAYAISTDNLAIGAVTVGLSGAGNNAAHCYLSVPGGQVYRVLLVATYSASSIVPYSLVGDISNAVRECKLTNAPSTQASNPTMQRVDPTNQVSGYWIHGAAATLVSTFDVGGGVFDLQAWADYSIYGFNTTVTLTCLAFKR